MQIDQLLVQIDASTELLRRELAKGESTVRDFSNKTDKYLSGFAKKFTNLGANIRQAFATFGVGLSVVGIVNFTRSAIQSADAIGEAARAAGFSAERFQRLQVVFKQNGVEASEFDAAMRALNTRLGQFITTGGGPAKAAIEQLGLAQKIANGEIRTSEELFDAIVEAYSKIDNAAQQAALSAALFGRNFGAKGALILSQGTKALAEAEKAIGGVLTNETIRKADALADAFDRLGTATGNWFKTLAIAPTYDLAKLFGVEMANDLAIQLDELKRRRDNTVGMERAGLGVVVSSADLNKQIELLEKQIELEKLRQQTPPSSYENVLEQVLSQNNPQQKLEEITGLPTEYLRRPPNPWMPDAGQLQEIRVPPPIRMPAEMRSMTPVMQQWKKINEEMEKYEKATERARERQEELADAMAASFESRGIEALVSGDLRKGLRGFIQDIAELILRMTVLRPLAEKLAASLQGIGGSAGGAGKGFFAQLFGSLFGGFRADGGSVSAGRAYWVGETEPELFVPSMAGQIIPGRMMGGGGINQFFYNQIGLPPQWEAQVAVAGRMAANAAFEATQMRLGGRR